MTRHPVSSSHLRSVGYDPETSPLEVEFKDGSVYDYFGVSQAVCEALMLAGSKGKASAG